MTSWETFKLSELRLDQKNYRTGPQKSQRDALFALIEDQQTRTGNGLVNIAEDILAMNGVSPGEPIWVTRDTDNAGMYVVLEGNRRVSALKLMETPTLADGTSVEKEFRALAEQYRENPIRELMACVYASREEAQPWQRRRHLSSGSGVGLQGWKPLAKARADRDQGESAPRFLAVVDFLQDDTEEWSSLADVLDAKWTTVDRILNSSSLPSLLGIDINLRTGEIAFENGDIAAGKALLVHILRAVASPTFRFSQIEKDTDRENFVNGFAALSVKAKPASTGSARSRPSAASTPESATTRPSAPAQPAPTRQRLTTTARSTLAPKNGPRTFQVNGIRLNPMYRECRDIKVRGNENAAALLLRVFIELSSEALLVEKNIPVPAGKTSWADFGINLSAKVNQVLNILDATGRSHEFQQIRVAGDRNNNATFSIITLHSYFHNLNTLPVGSALQEAWDVWEIYLRKLHEAR